MNIIIVGAGGVGLSIAENLNNEGHQITLVDSHSGRIDKVLEKLDVQAIVGNGVSHQILEEAGIRNANLLIAVTEHDEVNLLCCLIGKKCSPGCQTIARVRNPVYSQEISTIKDELGLSLSINPEQLTALEISHLINIPNAMTFESFAKGRIGMIQLQIPVGSPVHEMKVMDFSSKISKRTLICILEHAETKEVEIPRGGTVLHQGDRIYVITPPDEMSLLFRKMGFSTKPSRNIMIIGGGRISYYLAERLLRAHNHVTILEKDPDRCSELSDLLPSATIVNGDEIDRHLLLEEGLSNQDAVVTLTDLDEENIMLSMYAGKLSKARIITQISTIGFTEITEDLPLGSVVNPKEISAETILRYVRAMHNSSDSSNIESLYYLANRRVYAIEFYIKSESAATGKSLADLRLKQNVLICCIYRHGQAIVPTGKDSIERGDTVILVTTDKKLNSINDILQ